MAIGIGVLIGENSSRKSELQHPSPEFSNKQMKTSPARHAELFGGQCI